VYQKNKLLDLIFSFKTLIFLFHSLLSSFSLSLTLLLYLFSKTMFRCLSLCFPLISLRNCLQCLFLPFLLFISYFLLSHLCLICFHPYFQAGTCGLYPVHLIKKLIDWRGGRRGEVKPKGPAASILRIPLEKRHLVDESSTLPVCCSRFPAGQLLTYLYI
jgi:hypothetical protein